MLNCRRYVSRKESIPCSHHLITHNAADRTHLRVEVIIYDLSPPHFSPISVHVLEEKHARVALGEIVQIFEVLAGDGDFYLGESFAAPKRRWM